jgi:hypothetical protein
MLIRGNIRLIRVSGITHIQEQRILDFLQGAVYAYCANKPNDWFSARDFLGAVNSNWRDTPLQVLHDKHRANGKNYNEAKDSAGKEAGKLLKNVIVNELRKNFDTRVAKRIRQYKLV